MRYLALGTGALLATMTLASPALAYPDRIDARQHRQEWRIEQGIRHGQLTRHEARRLERQQRHIRRMERRARARNHGYVDPRTRHRIERLQDRASLHIRRLKHNRRGY